jgi:AraC-like DNA-binding protein/predicted transcriptional regulator YdeE
MPAKTTPVAESPAAAHEATAAIPGEEALTRAHVAAVAYIESHLFEPMTVKSISAHAGFSPSRFSRGFTRLQGESVMAYVHGRRLEEALRRMLAEPDVRLVDLAFDSGFDSQEAFTRAFARAFGHPPGRLRSLGVVRSMVRKKKTHGKEPQIHARVEQVPEVALAGLVERFSPARYAEMPSLWERLGMLGGFKGRLSEAVHAVLTRTYPQDGSFDYMVALRVDPHCSPPRELQRLTLPESTYVVFRHLPRGTVPIYPQVIAARELIRSRYLPNCGHELSDSLPFEVYPHGLNVRSGSFVDFYHPIRT